MWRWSDQRVRYDVSRIVKRTGSKENPGEASQRECRGDFPHCVSPRVRREPCNRGDTRTQILRCDGRNQIEPVERAPDNERPVRAVPQAAQEKRHEKIEIPARPRGAVTAERNVDVIAEP